MISPRTITQIGWAGSLPEVKSPLSQALNAMALNKTWALERCQQLCWGYCFCESAGIHNEEENQIPTSTEKEHLAFPLRKALACCLTPAAFRRCPQAGLTGPEGPVGVPSAEPAARAFFTPSHLPRWASSPPSSRPHIKDTATRAFCSHAVRLRISKGWCFLSPSASKFFNISDLSTLLYTSETWPCITVQSFY